MAGVDWPARVFNSVRNLYRHLDERNLYSKQWATSPCPISVFFMKDGHAIHGSFDVKNLGLPVSHGCVRISPRNATTLYAR
jgi:hypothetical protein